MRFTAGLQSCARHPTRYRPTLSTVHVAASDANSVSQGKTPSQPTSSSYGATYEIASPDKLLLDAGALPDDGEDSEELELIELGSSEDDEGEAGDSFLGDDEESYPEVGLVGNACARPLVMWFCCM